MQLTQPHLHTGKGTMENASATTTISPIKFERFKPLADSDCQPRILAAKQALGRRLQILGHHYQRADVYRHADLTGDSLGLSKLARKSCACSKLSPGPSMSGPRPAVSTA